MTFMSLICMFPQQQQKESLKLHFFDVWSVVPMDQMPMCDVNGVAHSENNTAVPHSFMKCFSVFQFIVLVLWSSTDLVHFKMLDVFFLANLCRFYYDIYSNSYII